MQDNLIVALQDRWMSEKEAKVYLTVLELGSSPASTIGRWSGIKRVTAYAVLKDLEMKQIVSKIEKDGVSYFQSISPDKLKQKLIDKVENFDAVMPQLLASMDVYNNKPKIEYFEGLKWLKQLYNSILEDASEVIYWYIWSEGMCPILETHLYEYNIPKRVSLWIRAKIILSETPGNLKYSSTSNESLVETKILKWEILTTASEINLYGGDKVAQIMYHENDLVGIVIQNQALHDNFLSIFNFIWAIK